MKKLSAFALILLLMLSLASCGPKTETKYLQTSIIQEYPGTVTIRTENEYDDEGLLLNAIQYYNEEEAYRSKYIYTESSVSIEVSQNGQSSTMTQVYEKDNDGNITWLETAMGGVAISSSVYTYDQNGKPLTQVQTNTDGTVYETTHVYDEKGNILQTTLDLGQDRGTVTNFTYDAQGKLLTAVIHDLFGNITSQEEHSWISPVEETIMVYDAAGVLTETQTNTYDEAGNLLVNEVRDAAGTLSSRISYTYEVIEIPVAE